MPLYWHLNSELRLVRAVAVGAVTRPDIEAYLRIVERADAVGWRKLIDARDAELSLQSEDVLALGARLRMIHDNQAIGALAVVMPVGTPTPQMPRLLGFLASAKRPMRLFDNSERARRWIMMTKQISD